MKLVTSNIPRDLLEVTKLAVDFYVNRYFKKRTRDRIDVIKICFRKGTTDDLAYASYEDNDRKLPVEFMIEFNNMYRDTPVREYLITLFHEMTHILQYAEGRLKSSHLHFVWENVRWDDFKQIYWDCPWEREALSIELGAYTQFSDAHEYLGLKRWRPTYSGRAESGWEFPVKSTT